MNIEVLEALDAGRIDALVALDTSFTSDRSYRVTRTPSGFELTEEQLTRPLRKRYWRSTCSSTSTPAVRPMMSAPAPRAGSSTRMQQVGQLPEDEPHGLARVRARQRADSGGGASHAGHPWLRRHARRVVARFPARACAAPSGGTVIA